MNKKGTFVLTGMMILGVVALVGLLSFVLSPTLRYTLIGMGIIGATFIYAIPAMIGSEVTRNKVIVVCILIGVGILVVFIPKLGLIQMEAFPSSGKLVKEIYGKMECGITDDWQPMSQIYGTFGEYNHLVKCDSEWYKYNIECNSAGTIGCEFKVNSFNCRDATFCPGGDPYYRVGESGTWTNVDNQWVSMSNGENIVLYTQCRLGSGTISHTKEDGRKFKDNTIQPVVDFRKPSMKLKIETYSHSWSGWIDGTEGCKLVSGKNTDLDNAINSQIIGAESIKVGETYALGQTQNFVIGWEEVTTFGNVNPLGKYNDMNVICKPLLGLYEVELIKTIGGNNYYVEGNQLISYAQDNTLCCNNGQCATDAGYVCEDYHCTKDPIMCELGSCNEAKRGKVLDTFCESRGIKFYLITQSCGNDLCIEEIEEEVKCCRDYCDTQYGEDYYCNYDIGCVNIDVLKECGSGYCCIEGGDFKVQECPVDKECCLDEVIDEYRGICRDECLPQPDTNDTKITMSDCEKLIQDNPNRWQWIETTTERAWYELWKDKETTTGYCKDNYKLYFILGGIGIFIIIITLIITLTNPKKKKGKKKGGKKK